jgi:hypothetical protein
MPSSMSSRLAKLVHAHRGHQVGHEQEVDDEAGAVLGLDRRLADLLGEGGRALDSLVGGVEADDHLDELHDRHRREEVQPEDAIGAPGGRREAGDRDGRGVRREDRLGAYGLVEVLERLRLDRGVLDDRLDDELGLGERVEVGRPLDARQQRLALVAGEALALDRACDGALDRGARVLEGRGLRLVEPDGHAGPRG